MILLCRVAGGRPAALMLHVGCDAAKQNEDIFHLLLCRWYTCLIPPQSPSLCFAGRRPAVDSNMLRSSIFCCIGLANAAQKEI